MKQKKEYPGENMFGRTAIKAARTCELQRKRQRWQTQDESGEEIFVTNTRFGTSNGA